MPDEREFDVLEFERQVEKRIEAIISEQAKDNEVAIGRLKAAEDRWGDLTKSLEKSVRTGLDVVAKDRGAMDLTKREAEEHRRETGQENTLVVSGKCIDKTRKVGLPGLEVTVVPLATRKPTKLKSDRYGNFTVKFPPEEAGRIVQGRRIAFMVVWGEGRAMRQVYRDIHDIGVGLGEVMKVTLLVECRDEMEERLRAGLSVRASMVIDSERMKLSEEKMEKSASNVTKVVEISRRDVGKLSRDLVVEAPKLKWVRPR
jgi:hypothetical protein